MTLKLVMDNTALNAFQEGTLDLDAAQELDAEYYVPVTQQQEFVTSFERLKFDKQYDISKVIYLLNLEPLPVSPPYGVAYGLSYGGRDREDDGHYDAILKEMGDHENHSWDALGAEAAIDNDMKMVTNDGNLIQALKSYSPENLLTQEDFASLLNSEGPSEG